MAITKMTGRTHDMLAKDKRVSKIMHNEDGAKVLVILAPAWMSGGNARSTFDNWEAARNWVRKAVNVEEAVA